MNKYFTLLFLLFLSSVTFSQEVQVSKRVSLNDKSTVNLIGKVGDNLLVHKKNPESHYVLIYDNEVQEKVRKEIEFANNRARVQRIVAHKNKFTILYKYYKRSKIHIVAHQYDENAELLDSTYLKIVDLKGNTNFARKIELSQNKRYALIHDTDPDSRLFTMVFDLKTMKILWEKTFRPKEVDYEKEFHQILIDNNGNAYFLFAKDNKQSKRSRSRFSIFQYQAAENKARQYDISTEGYPWYDILFSYDNLNQRIVGAGLYSENRFGEANGVSFIKFNPNDDAAVTRGYTPFDKTYLVTVLGKKRSNRIDGFGDVDIREVILRSDGGLLLVAERNYYYTRRTHGLNTGYEPINRTGGGYNIVDYYFNDILLYSFNSEGELEWKDLLRKRQTSQDDSGQYSSFFLLKTKKNLRFLYNDEIQFDTNVYEYVVSGPGPFNRNNVLNTSRDKLFIIMQEAIQVSANAAIFPSVRRSDFKLVKISF